MKALGQSSLVLVINTDLIRFNSKVCNIIVHNLFAGVSIRGMASSKPAIESLALYLRVQFQVLNLIAILIGTNCTPIYHDWPDEWSGYTGFYILAINIYLIQPSGGTHNSTYSLVVGLTTAHTA